MRKMFLFIVILALALSFTAVNAQEDLSGIDPTGATVVYWHQYSPDSAQGNTIAALIEQFNTTNEYGITVEGLHQGSYGDIQGLMDAGIVSGELPTLVAAFTNAAADWAADGVVVDMNLYYADATWGFTEEEQAQFNQGLLEGGVSDGVRIAWPNQISSQMLVVNQTLLAQAGIEALPTTFAEFEAAACAVSELTGPNGEDIQGYAIVQDASEFESFIAAFGGNIFADGAYTLNTEPVINAMTYLQNLYNNGCAYVPAERFQNTADFALGLNAMAMTSTAGFPFIIGDFAESGVEAEWAATTLPAGDGTDGPILQAFVPSIVMIDSTPEQEVAAWEFLKFLASVESQTQWALTTGYFPTNTAVELAEADFADAALYPYFTGAIATMNDPAVSIYVSPPFASYSGVRGLLSEAIARVVSGGEDPATVAAELETAANELHTESMGG
jgi:multiple sugar transport system substrate-binding protein